MMFEEDLMDEGIKIGLMAGGIVGFLAGLLVAVGVMLLL